MKVALYIGDHGSDTWIVRATCWLIRLAQKGSLGNVTHVEAVHAEHSDGTVTIASASLRDGGVRTKRVHLDPAHWRIVDVPQWMLHESRDWFVAHDKERYDWRGALAVLLPGAGVYGRWFCNQAVGQSVGLKEAGTFGPHHFAAIALTLGKDVTERFFTLDKHH